MDCIGIRSPSVVKKEENNFKKIVFTHKFIPNLATKDSFYRFKSIFKINKKKIEDKIKVGKK